MIRILALLAMLAFAGCVSPASDEDQGTDPAGMDQTQTGTEPNPGSEQDENAQTPDEPQGPSEPSGEEPQPPSNSTEPTDPPLPEATEYNWGEPAGKAIRPGINMVTDGAGCTTSFIFTENHERYFLSTAAHCVAGGESTDTNGCTAPKMTEGTTTELQLDDGSTLQAPLVYASWNTMQDRGETDQNACQGNDFALIEIPQEHWDKLHPASLHFQAPTALATSPTSSLWGYGASTLKFGIEPTHPKQGIHMGITNDGWSHFVYLLTPGIPGDSGGHIMTSDGQALGVASTLGLTPYPAANYYTDFAKAIAYAEEHAGFDLELVTWDNFNASLT